MGHSGRRGRDQKVETIARQRWAAGTTVDDHRWLGAASDEVRAAAGAVIARGARPARWTYLVVEGEITVGGEPAGPGACVSPAAGDVVATGPAHVLALRAGDEAELRHRFPALDAVPAAAPAPAPARACASHCPVTALLSRRREPVPAGSS